MRYPLRVTILWVSMATVLSAQSDRWTLFTKANSPLDDEFVLSLAKDSAGAYWIGTMSAGLYRLDSGDWTRYHTDNSALPSDTVTSILFHPNGDQYVGTHGGGLVGVHDGKWNVYDTANSVMLSNDVSANGLILDKDSSLWIGTWGGGVCKQYEYDWVRYDTVNSDLPDATVWTAGIDSSGAVWFGTLDGLCRYDRTSWTVYTDDSSGLLLDDVAALATDHDGTLWIGTWGAGLVRYHASGGGWTTYDAANSELPANHIEALHVDSAGRLWIGTWGGGVAVLDDGSWTIFDTANSPLPSNNVRQFLNEQETETIWICTQGGLAAYRYGDPSGVPSQPPNASVIDVTWNDGALTVHSSETDVSNARLTIWTTSGASAGELIPISTSRGECRFELPDNFEPGIYVYDARVGLEHGCTGKLLHAR